VEWDALATKFGAALSSAAREIGGDVPAVADTYAAMFAAVRKILHTASKVKKPSDAVRACVPACLPAEIRGGGGGGLYGSSTLRLCSRVWYKPQRSPPPSPPWWQDLTSLRKSVTDAMAPIRELLKKRDCSHPNHVQGAADAGGAFSWAVVDSGALGVVDAARESCDFYLNKVRREGKDKNLPAYAVYANTIRDSVVAIQEYVKENFKMGIPFNPKGVTLADYNAATSATSEPSATVPSPVSAAPSAAAAAGGAGAVASTAAPPAPAAAAAPPAGGAGGGRPALSALFSELSAIDQSSGRTAGLRAVPKSERSTGLKGEAAIVKASAAPTTAVSRADRGDAIPTGTPATVLEDKRWKVDFHVSVGLDVMWCVAWEHLTGSVWLRRPRPTRPSTCRHPMRPSRCSMR